MVLIDSKDKTFVVEEQMEEKPMTPLVMTTTLASKLHISTHFAQHANQTCTTSQHISSNLHFVKGTKKKCPNQYFQKRKTSINLYEHHVNT
jgi:hypothetical protein